MSSLTAKIMDSMKLYGAGNIPLTEDKLSGEEDFAQDAVLGLQHINEMFMNTPLERYTPQILSSIIYGFARMKSKITQDLDYLQVKTSAVIREQDGSEIKSTELEELTAKSIVLEEHTDEFEDIISALANEYSNITGRPWSITHGSIPRSRTGTSAVLDAKDVIAARKAKIATKHTAEGNLVAFGGGASYKDHEEIYTVLERVRNTVPKMVLMHGGQTKGAELIASKWAKENNVDQIIYKPDFAKHQKAAPFKRNDAMIDAKPEKVIIFPGNGITKNLAQKAKKAKISVTSYANA